ncbi:hypothetical protein GWI33_007732 [Rhynchophorus ferrugineus]|uniref:Alpha/beta hydrolase fold-3 domain-containing protein n=1 Tax=Rhynchophorus ferrugineus TaxID=354439 RepID=A0A834IH91_RHYFE|nr:hypothetical protein GWI33_007732 [Rhynchophorus ferrugineus]
MEKQLSELDKLYYPHWWQKRYQPEEALEKFICYLNNVSQAIPKGMRIEFNAPYGYKSREIFNIYGIDLPNDSPIVIHVHGGYWQAEPINHTNQGFISKQLYKNNVKLITIGYELCPNVTVEDIMTEIVVALGRCIDYAKKNMSKGIYLIGHSVGAHLLACMFREFVNTLSYNDQELIKSVYLMCGIYDLTPLPKTEINELLKLTDEEAKEISPQFMALSSPEHINFHVIVAEHDAPPFIEQAYWKN